jgi:hypothetical protein
LIESSLTLDVNCLIIRPYFTSSTLVEMDINRTLTFLQSEYMYIFIPISIESYIFLSTINDEVPNNKDKKLKFYQIIFLFLNSSISFSV